METKTELLPCPCCGGKAEMDIEYIGHDAFPMIQCQFCRLKLVWYSKEEGVLIEKWNTRVYPAEVQAAIERDTPKKPVIDDPFSECPMWECQKCKDLFFYDHNSHTMHFCSTCGQRLDWSEE